MVARALAVALLVPVLVAGLCLVAAWRPWRGRLAAGRGRWGGAAALGLGFAAGHVGLLGWPSLPPVDAGHWTFFAALLAAALGPALEGPRPAPARLARLIPVLLLPSVVVLVLRPMIRHAWEPSASAWWLHGGSAV
jgi:hypothetical protein